MLEHPSAEVYSLVFELHVIIHACCSGFLTALELTKFVFGRGREGRGREGKETPHLSIPVYAPELSNYVIHT